MSPPARHPTRHHGRRGFTLLEIMFAIMILGVGLIAVASMFPVASQVQQNTIEDMMAQEAAANATALLRTHGINRAAVGTVLAEVVPYGTTTLEERSYPSSINNINQRLYYWRAMARKQGSSMQAFVVVMKRRGATPPALVSKGASSGSTTAPYTIQLDTATDHLFFEVGSTVLDDRGNMYRILLVDRGSGVLTVSGKPDTSLATLWTGDQDTRGRGSTIRVFAVGGIPLRN